MIVKLEGINSGRYNLHNSLFFNYGTLNFIEKEFRPAHIELEIDKKSALEIMATLLDSENLLTKEAEDLIEKIEERIEKI